MEPSGWLMENEANPLSCILGKCILSARLAHLDVHVTSRCSFHVLMSLQRQRTQPRSLRWVLKHWRQLNTDPTAPEVSDWQVTYPECKLHFSSSTDTTNQGVSQWWLPMQTTCLLVCKVFAGQVRTLEPLGLAAPQHHFCLLFFKHVFFYIVLYPREWEKKWY